MPDENILSPSKDDIRNIAIWDDLGKLPPEAAAFKSGASLSMEGGSPVYSVMFFNEEYKVDPRKKALIPPEGIERAEFQELVAISNYLTLSWKGPSPGLSGIEAGPFSLPSGPFFFKGPHALPGKPIADKYGKDPEGFRQTALLWKAEKVAENGFKIRALPNVEIYFYLEPEDEEFEACARFNFDSNIIHSLALDGIFALTNELALRLLGIRPKALG
jgi:hypothetical protein